MRPFPLLQPGPRRSVLGRGAPADAIEIGAGGAVRGWVASGAALDICWQVLSAPGERAEEAYRSAASYVAGANTADIGTAAFRDSLFPEQGAEIKAWMEALKRDLRPDIILTHRRDDAHQDHRTVSQLTWNTFRDHLILEYEIPKWDGDLGQPNLYVPFGDAAMERKIGLLHEHFASQRSKDWFDAETFRGLARLRGAECRSPGRYAEAFVLRKAIIG